MPYTGRALRKPIGPYGLARDGGPRLAWDEHRAWPGTGTRPGPEWGPGLVPGKGLAHRTLMCMDHWAGKCPQSTWAHRALSRGTWDPVGDPGDAADVDQALSEAAAASIAAEAAIAPSEGLGL